MLRTGQASATSGSSLGVGCSFPCHGWCCINVIFGLLDFSLTDYMVSEDFFTEHIFSWGSRTSAPSWRPRGHGLHYAIFLLFGSLMLFQLNYMAWIFEYVATYATACSLLQPCEPLCWSWLCRPAALGEKEASCAIRQAPAVHSSSGELLLLSHSFVWNGICVSHLVCCDFLSRLDGGICSFFDSQFLDDIGEEATTLLPLQLGPVPSPGVINLLDILQDTEMTGVRVPPGPPTGGEPNSDSTSWPSHGGKMVGGATQHRTTARDCNMMPCPTHVLSVWCAIFRPPASTEILQKVAGNYKYYFGNRSLWQPPFGPACCAGRQQTAFSAGVIAPLVYPGFFVETMSAICVTCRSHCKGTGVSGAAGRPGLRVLGAGYRPTQLHLGRAWFRSQCFRSHFSASYFWEPGSLVAASPFLQELLH